MAAITLNEIRRRLNAFSKQWQDAKRENADAKLFWARFYECFGIRPESATIYEKEVNKLGGGHGFIDSFIPGKLIVEHKSKGKDLDAAFDQASKYFLALRDAERPRYIITSDFARFRLTDLKHDIACECKLDELSKCADWFSFLLEEDAPAIVEESPINREAAYQISRLHEALLRAKFAGRDLEVFLTRLLFCLFADDTGIFGENNQFVRLVEASRDDGKDLGSALTELFQVLNQPRKDRQSTLDEALAAFEYINGSLFAESTRIPSFNHDLRQILIECARLDWSGISPAIFGAMFQGVMEQHHPDAATRQATRRELGAHYTSERNILRVINPLCMNGLRAEFEAARNSKPRLRALYDKLPKLIFFDPACGCGNFLVIAYRDLRRLENEVIAALWSDQKGLLDVSTLCRVKVNQFYGIEIDESAAHIARVALWITDHQMNLEAAQRFGTTRATVPLVDSPTIVCDNALRINWGDVLQPAQCSYVLGNPPFIGSSNQTKQQKADLEGLFSRIGSAGVLDYVAAWYVKALDYIRENRAIHVAFVSTNSITQGEQVGILWGHLLAQGIHIHFAHRTFQWSNEGIGVAAVHCVIIGFGFQDLAKRTIFDYGDNIKGEPTALQANNINPYLVDAATVLLEKRRVPISAVPEMVYGSKPTDGGNLLLSDQEKNALVKSEPLAEKWIRPFLGADEFLSNIKRWCLWLVDITPNELRALPAVYERVERVKQMRLASPKIPTVKLSDTPTLFGEIRQTNGRYILIPLHSSENRRYIPIGYFDERVICGNANSMLPNATLYHFGMLCSTMHNAWLRYTCGRIKSDYRYSNTIVYNNYPWPFELLNKHRITIEFAAQGILDARTLFLDSSLADLYDDTAMPPALREAHDKLDKAVDTAYGYKGDNNDAVRVAFLFGLYQRFTSLFPTENATSKLRKKHPGVGS